MNILEEAKKTLDTCSCTLVVANHGEIRKYYQRGVNDLVDLLENDPGYLRGATVADKIIGKAAASLMIEGCVERVFTRVITADALKMFKAQKIPVEYNELAEIVENRTKTGRCPIDTICAPLTDIHQMTSAIRNFIESKRNKA